MPRRKQDKPQPIRTIDDVGEDDTEGGASSLTIKDGVPPVNQEQEDQQDEDEDGDDLEGQQHLSSHLEKKVLEEEDDNDSDKEDESEAGATKSLIMNATALDVSPDKRRNRITNNKKSVIPTQVLSEDESDDEADDEDDIPLKMVVEDEQKDVSLPPPVAPLDFSVKPTSGERSKRISSSSSSSKEKKIKTSNSPTSSPSSPSSSTFPLDLSVKKSSNSSNSNVVGNNNLFNKSLSSQMAALRDFMPMIPFTSSSPLAKLSSRASSSSSVSQSSSLSKSGASSSSASAFASLALRMGSLVPNGVDVQSNSTSTTSKSKVSNKTFPGPSGLITRSSGNHGRQNPWQTQWINRSSEQTRDVFTCVWCKESFRSLQEMTLHMKESPRCGMAGMQHAAASLSSNSSNAMNSSSSNNNGNPAKNSRVATAVASSSNISAASSTSSSPSASKEPMSNAVLAKNNVSLPRKLVRGQDVWLGRGAEQTRQILKCMWCAQSFKTLDEMTRHMRVTQHYTNIISQEQIISWRTPEDKLAQAQVNAVLTCKVCDEAFGSLKELSYHMVKNAHYKEHILRSITEGGHGRRRQTRERRKKSLPVRKLLELERMEITQPKSSPSSSRDQKDVSSSSSKSSDAKGTKDTSSKNLLSSSSNIITCDECGTKVETKHLINHLKHCKRSSSSPVADSSARSPSVASSGGSSDNIRDNNTTPSPSPPKKLKLHESLPSDEKEEEEKTESKESKGPSASSACLSALQSLIDKSFDVKLPAPSSSSSKHNNIPSSSSLSHLEHQSRKLNGSRHHHHHSKEHHSSKASSSSKSLPVSASLSAVEKWMALAKERDVLPSSSHSNLWSPSVSSESSSWLCSEEDDVEEGVALKANKPLALNPDRDSRSSPVSSGTGSRPGSVHRTQTSSPSETPSSVIKTSKNNKQRTSKEVKNRDETEKEKDLKNEEEERREEIEELKRSANSLTTDNNPSSPSRPSTSSASLSALEKLIEKSFDSKKKNTPTGFLQRLGIDEEVCPPWQPGLSLGLGLGAAGLPFGHAFQPWLIPKHGGRSSSSSPSKGTKNGSVSSSPPV